MEIRQHSRAVAGARPEAIGDRQHRSFLLVVLGIVVAALWFLPLGASLWLDEAGTYWVIKDGWRETIDRATRFQGQTPTYYLIVWASRVVLGETEVALRVPSLLSLALGTYLLWRLGRRLFDSETGLLASLVFASLTSVALTAANARPYAVALAAAIGSTLALVRWLEGRGLAHGVAYAVLAGLVIHLHYLFAPLLLTHATFVAYRWMRGGRPPLHHLAVVGALLSLLLLPTGSQLMSLVERRDVLTFAGPPPFQELLRALAPPVVVAGTLGGLLLARLAGSGLEPQTPVQRPDVWVLVVAWATLPPIALFLAARLGAGSVFAQRYLLSAAPGLALAAGWVLRAPSYPLGRRVAATALTAVAILSFGRPEGMGEDWRAAARAVNDQVSDPETPVLLYSGLIEAAQVEWLRDPEKRDYLNSPFVYYEVRGRLIPLPNKWDQEVEAYLEEVTRTVLLPHDRFLLVMRCGCVPIEGWLDGRLVSEGYSSRVVGQSGVSVVLFEKEEGTP